MKKIFICLTTAILIFFAINIHGQESELSEINKTNDFYLRLNTSIINSRNNGNGSGCSIGLGLDNHQIELSYGFHEKEGESITTFVKKKHTKGVFHFLNIPIPYHNIKTLSTVSKDAFNYQQIGLTYNYNINLLDNFSVGFGAGIASSWGYNRNAVNPSDTIISREIVYGNYSWEVDTVIIQDTNWDLINESLKSTLFVIGAKFEYKPKSWFSFSVDFCGNISEKHIDIILKYGISLILF